MIQKYYVWIAACLAALYVFMGWMPSRVAEGYNLESFAKLPVQDGGRFQPLDSVARNNLMIFSERQYALLVEEDSTGRERVRKVPSQAWMVEVATRPEVADDMKVFRILHPTLRTMLDIEDSDGRVFSFSDLRPHFAEINRQFNQIDPEPQRRDTYEKAIAKLQLSLTRYHRLIHSFHPMGNLDRIRDEYTSYLGIIDPGMVHLNLQQQNQPYDQAILENFMAFADRYLKLSQEAILRIIPPAEGEDASGDWENVGESLLRSIQTRELDPYVISYAELTEAYRQGNPDRFNRAVNDIRTLFTDKYPNDKFRVSYEYSFNEAEPFYRASVLYVIVLLLILISWLRWTEPLNRIAFAILLVAFLVHTFGLVSRMYIQGRPPVTNLYSSAVFVGWGAVLLGLIFERIFRNGFGSATAALIGFCTLIIAHHLSLSGDTLELMRAVLDSNFWLATHVIVITIGYSAVFLAGGMAIFYLIRGVFTKGLDRKSEKTLGGMVYGVTCFALLFSFVGTMLGGIWADQSWGRFWGWDPKENGALMIVIWGAIMLHARWGALVKTRGFMVLAIFGNVVTAWSWFGTNMLGVGLHSYGFMDEAFFWLSTFVISQLAIMAIGMIPKEKWRSAPLLLRSQG